MDGGAGTPGEPKLLPEDPYRSSTIRDSIRPGILALWNGLGIVY